jgi:hypothetical protein
MKRLGDIWIGGKMKLKAEALIARIRRDLRGNYASVPIRIERSGTSWIALADVQSAVTRERIENAASRVRRDFDLSCS